MNIGGLFGALTPVFFVLALGYLAGKRNAFDADQSAGLSKLALTFALPASLFVSMTDIRKDLLLEQGLVLALILSHAGLFVAAWLLLRLVKSLSGTASIIYALMLATSATPVFGLAVLEPLLGSTSGGAVGLVALAINLTVPPAVVLLEMDAAAKDRQVATDPSKPSAIVTGWRHRWPVCSPCIGSCARRFKLGVCQNLEGKLKPLVEFVLPLLGEIARTHDQTAVQVAADQQFRDEQTGHDRFPSAGIIREQES
jgi:predicted permease